MGLLFVVRSGPLGSVRCGAVLAHDWRIAAVPNAVRGSPAEARARMRPRPERGSPVRGRWRHRLVSTTFLAGPSPLRTRGRWPRRVHCCSGVVGCGRESLRVGRVSGVPDTRYATTHDGVSIAYQIVGEGPVDLVLGLSDWGNVETMWELDAHADLFERLSRFSRLVLHDRRGTGLSGGGGSFPNLETRARDLLAVLDSIRSPRTVLFGERTHGRRFRGFRGKPSEPCRVVRVEQGRCYDTVVTGVPVGRDGGRDAARRSPR